MPNIVSAHRPARVTIDYLFNYSKCKNRKEIDENWGLYAWKPLNEVFWKTVN